MGRSCAFEMNWKLVRRRGGILVKKKMDKQSASEIKRNRDFGANQIAFANKVMIKNKGRNDNTANLDKSPFGKSSVKTTSLRSVM